MISMKRFYSWPYELRRQIEGLNTPAKIQQFLDSCRYNLEGTPRVPLAVVKMRRAHCFDGAVFAASIFAYHGEPPLILDLCAVRDDDHILAIYRSGRYFGAVAKSNYTGLRFREPIFRNARELALSYFESYFNLRREKSLREYSEPFDLRKVKTIDWLKPEVAFEQIAEALVRSPHRRILTGAQEQRLLRVDRRSFAAGLVGVES